MIRTQVYLTEELARDIKLQAKLEKRGEAEIIRDLLSEGLKVKDKEPRETAGEALLRFAQIGERLNLKAEPDLSSRIDEILYDDPK